MSGSTSPGAGLGALDTDMDPADAMIHIARGVRHERERERERESVCVCVCVRVFMSVRERERESVCVRGRECEGESGRESVGESWERGGTCRVREGTGPPAEGNIRPNPPLATACSQALPCTAFRRPCRRALIPPVP